MVRIQRIYRFSMIISSIISVWILYVAKFEYDVCAGQQSPQKSARTHADERINE